MKYSQSLPLITIITVGTLLFYSCQKQEKSTMPNIDPPKAEQVPQEFTIHGDTRIDEYFWMRLTDEQKNAEVKDEQTQKVLDYLTAENQYLDTMLAHTKLFQDSLYKEIRGRIKEQDESVPYFKNGYWYYNRTVEGKEYSVYCRKKESLEAAEEVMFDVNTMAEGFDFYNLVGVRISPDNKLAMFFVDTMGRNKFTLQFKNLETGEILSDMIYPTRGSAAWANDNKTVFYGVTDPVTMRSYLIKKHNLGDNQSEDLDVYEEKDETFAVGIGKSKSDRYIYIGSYSTLTSESRFIDANKPNDVFKIIQPRTRELEYSVDDYGDDFYIKTNLDAKNFRLMKTPIAKAGKENWKEVIAHRTDVLLQDFDIFSEYLVVEERKEGLVNLRVIKWVDQSEYYIPFNDPAYLAYTSTNPEYNTTKLRYGYTSLTTPNSTFEWDMNTKENKLLKQQEVIGDFKTENYVSERIYATAKDGVKVPISLVYRKGFKKDGTNPTLLYGYGSYGATMDAYFSSVRLSLLDRGFVYAIAHIRGGEEMGRHWYEDGKLLKKMNTFTDFIACGEHLVNEKYAAKDKLFAEGGSAGGLLMGAVVNLAPDMWRGVIAAVPFVDVINTMLDESIPLTTGEFDEWGNPKDSVYYFYMKSYSPYDNVEAKAYPAMLVTTGLHDSQVQYWEPAKWVARLRARKTDNNKLYLKTDMSTGHGGKSGRFERLKDVALEYAFMFDLIGIKE